MSESGPTIIQLAQEIIRLHQLDDSAPERVDDGEFLTPREAMLLAGGEYPTKDARRWAFDSLRDQLHDCDRRMIGSAECVRLSAWRSLLERNRRVSR
jgi:hypothetical protein